MVTSCLGIQYIPAVEAIPSSSHRSTRLSNASLNEQDIAMFPLAMIRLRCDCYANTCAVNAVILHCLFVRRVGPSGLLINGIYIRPRLQGAQIRFMLHSQWTAPFDPGYAQGSIMPLIASVVNIFDFGARPVSMRIIFSIS